MRSSGPHGWMDGGAVYPTAQGSVRHTSLWLKMRYSYRKSHHSHVQGWLVGMKGETQ